MKDEIQRRGRRSAAGIMLGLVLIALLGACTSNSKKQSSSSSSGAAVAGGVGQPNAGQIAWKFVGRIDQDGDSFAAYGYITHLDGVDDADLFTSTTRDISTARLTVVIDAHATGKNKLDNLTVVDTTGTATIYFSDRAGGQLAQPASLKSGIAIATLDVTGQNVLSINPDNRDEGIAAATAELHQLTAEAFDLAGSHRTLGRPDLILRMAVNGPGKRTDATKPASTIEVAGDVIVAGA